MPVVVDDIPVNAGVPDLAGAPAVAGVNNGSLEILFYISNIGVGYYHANGQLTSTGSENPKSATSFFSEICEDIRCQPFKMVKMELFRFPGEADSCKFIYGLGTWELISEMFVV
jgi:hypothetical protein